jgi:hypothetical protein
VETNYGNNRYSVGLQEEEVKLRDKELFAIVVAKKGQKK